MATHKKTGDLGEQIAIAYLRKIGHVINDTNWRFEQFEIDIVSTVDDMIVFTEVKSRSGNEFGKPEDAVTEAKQRFLGKAADEYIYKKKYEGDIRFDIISIEFKKNKREAPEILHLEDAFFPIE